MDALEVAEIERNTAANEVQRFGLAHADMRIALATVKHLQSLPPGDPDLRFALEAAIAVIYVRPFNSPNIGSLRGDWIPEDGRDRYWHDEFVKLRDSIYAHTDEFPESGRRIREPHESEPPGDFTEEWLGWEPGDDQEVEALIAKQFMSLAIAAVAAQRRLRVADAMLHTLRVERESTG